jgi:hypothetical protein
VYAAHSPPWKASLAAATARSMSAAVLRGNAAHASFVQGSTLSIHSPDAGSTNSPST